MKPEGIKPGDLVTPRAVKGTTKGSTALWHAQIGDNNEEICRVYRGTICLVLAVVKAVDTTNENEWDMLLMTPDQRFGWAFEARFESLTGES